MLNEAISAFSSFLTKEMDYTLFLMRTSEI